MQIHQAQQPRIIRWKLFAMANQQQFKLQLNEKMK